jgi:membrane-bound serine protease (ClpP class)
VKRAGHLFATLGLAAAASAIPVQAAQPPVVVATLDGVINPITANYVDRTLSRATSLHATALVIALDTPGGLDTSMRAIIKDMLGASMPVVVYVSPSGARAASAGFFITEAADVAAVAPGTNVGSAHPVSIGGSNPVPNPSASPSTPQDIESIKVENDAAAYIRGLATLHQRNADWAEQAVRKSLNVPAEDAVRMKVVDLESRDLDALLSTLDGRTVSKNNVSYTIRSAGAPIVRAELSDFDRLLETLANPDVAYLLFLLALIGVGVWVTHPGLILPGVIGVIAAILAALALFNLPVNLAGLILIVTALVLFVVDLKATTHGVLTTGGIVAMSLGALLLVDTAYLASGVDIGLVVVSVLLVGGAFGFVLRKVIVARHRPYAVGEDAMAGRMGTVRERLDPTGLVFVDGALWQATSLSGPLDAGAAVRVVRAEGLRLAVEAARPHPGPGVMEEPPRAAHL